MEPLQLYKNNNTLYRVLDVQKDKCLVIDCNKRTMPFFIYKDCLNDCSIVTDFDSLNVINWDELTNKEKEKAESIYSSISSIVPFIGDCSFRNVLIDRCSKQFGVSKQTIRKRLCNYLVFQSLSVFINRKEPKELTEDEKTIRKALNRYYYTQSKPSLNGVYIRMLSEFYTDEQGTLKPHPSLSKFKRFYYKTVKKSNLIISRYGKTKFIKDFAPRLSNGVDEFYNYEIGVCEVDSTTADIWLVNDKNQVVGRPVISAGICPVTGLCLGLYIGWEESAETLRQMFINIAEDKVEYCKSHNVIIDKEQWPNSGLMRTVISDRGQSFVSNTIKNLSELGVTLISLEPFHPNYKGTIESFFKQLQGLYTEELINSGVIRKDIAERERPDYRLNACITLEDFKRIVIKCIVYLNSKRVIDIPYQYVGRTRPFACDYFALKQKEYKNAFIDVDSKKLRLYLLPRCTGYFRQDGVHLNGLRYKKIGYLNEYLQGISAEFAFNRFNVSEVYLIDDEKNFIPFELIDSYFEGKSVDDVYSIKNNKNNYINSFQEESLEARVELSNEIRIIDNIRKREAPKQARINGHRRVKQTEKMMLRAKENNNE